MEQRDWQIAIQERARKDKPSTAEVRMETYPILCGVLIGAVVLILGVASLVIDWH